MSSLDTFGASMEKVSNREEQMHNKSVPAKNTVGFAVYSCVILTAIARSLVVIRTAIGGYGVGITILSCCCSATAIATTSLTVGSEFKLSASTTTVNPHNCTVSGANVTTLRILNYGANCPLTSYLYV
ncbi:MAG: hypothetical protein IGS39_26960 [Calothrix sp. C42_A2020_038]|nr:hypothetical protein [Calothrix sp. C42_A2020_038]